MLKNKIGPLCYAIHQNKLKMDKRPEHKTWNHKTVRRKHRGKTPDIRLGNDFLEITPEVQTRKAKINKWYCINLKSFCTGKETINKMKGNIQIEEKVFESHISA